METEDTNLTPLTTTGRYNAEDLRRAYEDGRRSWFFEVCKEVENWPAPTGKLETAQLFTAIMDGIVQRTITMSGHYNVTDALACMVHQLGDHALKLWDMVAILSTARDSLAAELREYEYRDEQAAAAASK